MSEQSSSRALAVDSCALLAFFFAGVFNPGHTLSPGAVAVGGAVAGVAVVTLRYPRLVRLPVMAKILDWAMRLVTGLLCALGWSLIVQGIVDVDRLVVLVLPGLALSLALLRAKRMTRAKVPDPAEG